MARILRGELELEDALEAPTPAASPKPVEGSVLLEVGGAEVSARSVMESLGRLWLEGIPIDWSRLHEGETRRRIGLPTYPFERERYWVDPEVDPATIVAKRADLGTWFYHPQWRSSIGPVTSEGERPSGYLVFVDSSGIGEAVAEILSSRGRRVRMVPRRADGTEDYESLLAESIEGGDAILYFWSLEAGSFESVLHLVRALGERRKNRPTAVKLVTAGAHEVTGRETLSPEAAMIPALAKVITQESEHLSCSNVDLESGFLGRASRSFLSRLADELDSSSREPVVAFRSGRRWTPSYETIPLGSSEGTPPILRPSGVYWITGGLGEVGYVIAAYLAKRVKARLILSGRTQLPPKEEWDRHLAGPMGVRIRKVRSLEALGAEVLVVPADVSNESEMRKALSAALERFGEIHGVVHAAGVLTPDSFALVEHLDRVACERQFAPKVRGLAVLDRLLRGQPLDFWFLTSSLSVVLGGLGYSAYAAANAFLDVYAAKRNREEGEDGVRWKVVDWDQWSFGKKGGGAGSSLEDLAMTPMEGLATFEQILRMDYPSRVVISTAPLAA
ncbi:MAG: SDR family NAD(P)-dependent oxidoreductase, partial [Vicinamibacteria bacterium]